MLGLYLHVPFCQAICSYCNFNRGLFDGPLKARYVAALEREIREAGDGGPVDSIFFGGGTPSLLEPQEVAGLVDACRDAFSVAPGCEITLETNPETASRDRLRGFLDAGVNRLSIGVQSFDDAELARLGRVHSAQRAIEALEAAHAAGCANVSLDLMLWLPGQSPASWARTVARAIGLAPQHVSLYLLELYPNAPLKEAMARAAARPAMGAPDAGAWVQAAEDDAADMYLDGLALLDQSGYEQYEISNVAKPGFASRHNAKYWRSGTWRGFGCGAHSTVNGLRWKNVSATAEYVRRIDGGESVATDEYQLSTKEAIEEALFTGLRLTEGIGRPEFRERFGIDPWEKYGEDLASSVENGLMWVAHDRFGLTRRGMLVANEILVAFV